MDLNTDTTDILLELDGQRIACGMSYQAVADACGVSKSTIYRTLTGSTEPTVQLIQAIAAAVQYKPASPVIFPEECTQEAYIAYLKDLLQRQQEDNDRRTRQLQAHYNMLRRQDQRDKHVWMVLALTLAAIFVALFLYDFAHMDRGWIQAMQGGYKATAYDAFLAVKSWLKNLGV